MPPFSNPLYHTVDYNSDSADHCSSASTISSCSRLDQEEPTPITQAISPKAKRSVSFSPVVKARPTLHINSYTDEEMDQCFYTAHEMKSMKLEVKVGAKFLDKGFLAVANEEEFPTRGLELYSKAESKRRCELRFAATNAVLEQQKIQRAQG